jgi:hypothetical protein
MVEYRKLPGWKKINPYTRAEIILVNEGVKPAACSGDFNEELLIKTLERLELYHTGVEHRKERGKVKATVDYAKSKSHLDMLDREIEDDFVVMREFGKFYGYPECCVDQYVKDKKNSQNSGFVEKMKELVEKEGKYPEELEYLVPSMTPCDPKCPNALKTLGKWKETLEKYDPDAAKALRKFNKKWLDKYLEKNLSK